MTDAAIRGDQVEVMAFSFEQRRGRGNYEVVKVRAGIPTRRRVVPPAGDEHAFTVTEWPVEVEVTVSPTGRAVHVIVNGHEVPVKPRRGTAGVEVADG